MKKIIRLTESDLARIVKRVIKENALLTETVPLTAVLTASKPIQGLGARAVCRGVDYITNVSVEIKNTGTDAYIVKRPRLNIPGTGVSLISVSDFNVTIGGKPSWSSPDGQKQFYIPAGKSATLNLIIQVDVRRIQGDFNDATTGLESLTTKKREAAQLAAKTKRDQDRAAFVNAKSGTLTIYYNGGAPLEIPVTLGGFQIDAARVCDAVIQLPKGFQQ